MQSGTDDQYFSLPPEQALQKVTSEQGRGIYASADTLFKGAIFGRDSLEVAEDLLFVKPYLVERVLLTLAAEQGTSLNDKTEEEPGKIIHEFRTKEVDGRPLDDISRLIFEELVGKWGGNEEYLSYFGSVDSTPQFIRLSSRYISQIDKDFPNRMVVRRDGSEVTMQNVLEDALQWLTTKVTASKSGLLEYKRQNPRGIQNQVWKDSLEFYVHRDGTLVNHDQPVASIEVQGLAYDALCAGALLVPNKCDQYLEMANELRSSTIKHLWREQEGYFALGLDYAKHDLLRIIDTKTANPAALLDTTIFDGLTTNLQEKYIGGIVKTITSKDFLTDAGIRSRALSEASLVPFWDYHGSYTSWPKETYDIAKGLRRQGFPELARQLEDRLINVIRRAANYPEFFFVDADGTVLIATPTGTGDNPLATNVVSMNSPESLQAWTISAVISILSERLHQEVTMSPEEIWQFKIEQEVLEQIPHLHLLTDGALAERYPFRPFSLTIPKLLDDNSNTDVTQSLRKKVLITDY